MLAAHSPVQHEAPGTAVDALDDVFGSAPTSPLLDSNSASLGHGSNRRSTADPSDIPRLRSTHVTNGYRDGISASKSTFVQEGFDEGYSLGAVVGLQAGWCLGALEGINHALSTRDADSAQDSVLHNSNTPSGVRLQLGQAGAELTVQSLFGPNYFGADGIWRYKVPGHEDSDVAVTFLEVAAAHPLVSKWTDQVTRTSARLGLRLRLPFAPGSNV